jgi:hypothetical protein
MKIRRLTVSAQVDTLNVRTRLPGMTIKLERQSMYSKPKLVRYGTFRDLTLIGFGADGDGFSIGRLDGCDILPVGDCSRS